MPRWIPPVPTLVLTLLLAVTLSEGGQGGVSAVKAEASNDSGWVPIKAPIQREQEPKFGSRITKPRLQRELTTNTSPTRLNKVKSEITTSTSSAPVKSSKANTNNVRTRPIRQEKQNDDDDDEETKSLAQQVAEGKYGLIQNEIFGSGAPQRPGILSYEVNHEFPDDTAASLGGLRQDEIWLSEGHVLVLSGGSTGIEGEWAPIDNYQAPPRQVKIPPNPSVPPPFPVQLQDGGPTGFVISNKTDPFKYGPSLTGNFVTGNGINLPPFPLSQNGSNLPPPPLFYRQENLTQDDDDPSIFYPPPYDFSYHIDNTTAVPPGPLVPGIVLPPPPNFFAPQNKSQVPNLYIPHDFDPGLQPPPPPSGPDLTAPDHETNLVTLAPPTSIDNSLFPKQEPNVFFHHHGSPILISTGKNHTPVRVEVSPPEQLLVYELGQVPKGRGKTIVSSTPSPTALYYTLPPEPAIKLTIYSATPSPPVKQHHTQTFFAKAPKPRPFTTPKYHHLQEVSTPKYHQQVTTTPKYYEIPVATPKPPAVNYYNTPESVHLYPDTTPLPQTTVKTKPQNYYTITTTVAPPQNYFTSVPKGRYLPIQQPAPPPPQPPPRYLPSQRPSRPQFEFYFEQQQPPASYISRPNYYYPQRQRPIYQSNYQSPPVIAPPQKSKPQVEYYYSQKQQNNIVATTQNPIFNGYYTQTDAKFMDDITKSYFNLFGKKITTPLPPPTEQIPTARPPTLLDDTRVNFRRPLPPINPDSEFIRDPSIVSYQLPGQGHRGPSHYFFLTPRVARDEQQQIRSPRRVKSGERTTNNK